MTHSQLELIHLKFRNFFDQRQLFKDAEERAKKPKRESPIKKNIIPNSNVNLNRIKEPMRKPMSPPNPVLHQQFKTGRQRPWSGDRPPSRASSAGSNSSRNKFF